MERGYFTTVNLTGPMHLMRETVKVMKERGRGGTILNISSVFGVVSKAKRDSFSGPQEPKMGTKSPFGDSIWPISFRQSMSNCPQL